MARSVVQDAQISFSGGLNISADASQLAPNEVRRADNVRMTVYGGMLKRLGSRYVHASAIGSGNSVQGGYAWIKDDGTQQLLAISNGLLHYGSYGVPMTWTAVASPSVDASAYPSFAAFRDGSQEVVYIADGGRLLKWDGATLTRSATASVVSRLWVYNQRLYGCTGNDTILLASGLNDGDDLGYTTGEGVQVPIRTFGESSIIGGVSLGANNLIFHRRGISRWTGVTQDDINVLSGTQGISPDVGTIVAGSIVATETECFFLSDRGFYGTDGYGVRRISTTLDPNLFSLFTLSANLCSVHNRMYREVCWYLPDTGLYAYNYQTPGWTGPWNGGYISPITHSLWFGLNTTTNQPIVFVGTASGFVKQMDYPQTAKDNVLSDGTGGTAVTSVTQLRRLFFRNPASSKALRFAYVLANLNGSVNTGISWTTLTQSGSFTLTPSGGLVWDAPGAVWDDTLFWGSVDAQEYRVQMAGRGLYVDMTWTDSGTATDPPFLSSMKVQAYDYGEAHEYA